MKDKLEAILFAAGRYVDEEFMAKVLGEDIRKVRKALSELKSDYDRKQNETALQVVQEDKSWKLHVQDKYLDIVSKLVSDKEIAKTVLETLAIIAWKNPITQAELIKYRGPAAYEHVAELMERNFVTKTPEGRSFKLAITDKFFEYFDVEGREDIRKLFKQVEDVAGAQQAEVDQKKADYDAQKAYADATAKALAEGKEPPTLEAFKLANPAPTAPAHSAKAEVAELIRETKEELEKFSDAVAEETTTVKQLASKDQPDEEASEEADEGEAPETKEELIKDARSELAAFSEDLDKLKREELEKQEKAPAHHKAPAHPVKHHAAKKKK